LTTQNKLMALYLAALCLISGCSSTTPIQRADQSESGFGAIYNGHTSILRDDIPDSEAYRVFNKGASGFVPLTAVRGSTETRAADFCEQKSKVVEVLRATTSVSPHVLGNFPRYEIVFTCVASSTPPSTASKSDSYAELRELKALLDDGAISHEEYEKEKAEILAQ
jgi:hypothetical protein